jgi:hypothetical protein
MAMATIGQGDVEIEGYTCTWVVYRDNQGAYQAQFLYRVPEQRVNITVSKELPGRPVSKEAARQACDSLLPQFRKILQSWRATGDV